jgi:hypothetical protein
VRAITASRIQHARRTHPAQGDNPSASSSDTGKNNPASIMATGIHHASKLVRLLLSQSREASVTGLLIAY